MFLSVALKTSFLVALLPFASGKAIDLDDLVQDYVMPNSKSPSSIVSVPIHYELPSCEPIRSENGDIPTLKLPIYWPGIPTDSINLKQNETIEEFFEKTFHELTKFMSEMETMIFFLPGGPAQSLGALMNTEFKDVKLSKNAVVVAVGLRGTNYNFSVNDVLQGDKVGNLPFNAINTDMAACDVIYLARLAKRQMRNVFETIDKQDRSYFDEHYRDLVQSHEIGEKLENIVANFQAKGLARKNLTFGIFGHSYGTYLAQRVLSLDDSLFDRALLGGIVTADATFASMMMSKSPNKNLVKWCKQKPDCDQRFPNLNESLARFDAFLSEKVPSNPCVVVLQRLLANPRYEILNMLESVLECSDGKHIKDVYVNYIINDFFNANDTPIDLNQKNAHNQSIHQGVYNLIVGRDLYSPNEESENGSYFLAEMLRIFSLIAAKYGNNSTKTFTGYNGNKPILIYNGALDRNTPFDGAVKLNESLSNSALLEFPNHRHEYLLHLPCGSQIWNDFWKGDSYNLSESTMTCLQKSQIKYN